MSNSIIEVLHEGKRNFNLIYHCSIVTIARSLAEVYVAIGSEPIKWADRSDSIISLIDVFADLKSNAFHKPIPIFSFFNSIDKSVEFFKSTFHINHKLAIELSQIQYTPLHILQMIKQVCLMNSSQVKQFKLKIIKLKYNFNEIHLNHFLTKKILLNLRYSKLVNYCLRD